MTCAKTTVQSSKDCARLARRESSYICSWWRCCCCFCCCCRAARCCCDRDIRRDAVDADTDDADDDCAPEDDPKGSRPNVDVRGRLKNDDLRVLAAAAACAITGTDDWRFSDLAFCCCCCCCCIE